MEIKLTSDEVGKIVEDHLRGILSVEKKSVEATHDYSGNFVVTVEDETGKGNKKPF